MDRIRPRLTVLPFMVAFCAGLLGMASTNVFKICRGDVGFLDVTPYLRKRAGDIAHTLAAPLSWFASLWRFRVAFICAAALLALLAVDLSHAHAGVLEAVVLAAGTRRTQLTSELKEATKKAADMMAAADAEKRELAEEERGRIQSHLDEAKRLKVQIDRIDGDEDVRKQIAELSGGAERDYKAGEEEQARNGRRLSLGAQFVRADFYQRDIVKGGSHRQAGFKASMEMDVFGFDGFGATTLDESSGSGGKLVLPDYQQGIMPTLTRQIRVTQLLLPGTTNSNSVEYMKETTFTNAAAARAEAAAAAESTLVFDRIADPVRSIAHFLPVTQEMLEDQAQSQSYIDGRLRLGALLVEEDQLLNGDGTGANLTGLMARSGLATAVARGADTNADAIFKQIIAIMTNAFVVPDGVVLNPTNWQTIVLAKDGSGQYYGSGPFGAMQTPVLWGLPAAVTPVIVANTALVGAYGQCAQRFVRRGVTVTATNSHSDFFTKRLVAIMAEMREALCVYRPAAFGKVTGLN